MRDICINKLNNLINNETISTEIEEGIYNTCCKEAIFRGMEVDKDNIYFKRMYANKVMSIYVNLDPDSYLKNKNFLKRVLSGELDPSSVAELEPSEVFPEHWKSYKDKQNAYDEFLYSKSGASVTDEYKCGRCKERNCISYDLQTRSSDEPMTTFIKCITCGNGWSF